MNLPAEWLLIAGVAVFYLQDSMLLLYWDELAFERGRDGWHVSTGSAQTWAGRHPWLPAPWHPARTLLRGHWSPADGKPAAWDLEAHLAALPPLQAGCIAVGVLMLLALPALLLLFAHPVALLALLALTWTTIAAMVWIMARRRAALGLGKSDVLRIGAEALLCPPFAINLVRKLGLRRCLPGDALGFAAQRLAPAECARLQAHVDERLALMAALGTPRQAHGSLQALRERAGAARE